MKRILHKVWPVVGFFLLFLPLDPLGAAEKPGGKAAIGQVVSDFVLTDATGKDLKLSDLLRSGPKGESRPAVLIYWCTTCAPCRKEEAEMDKFYKEFKDRAVVAAIVGQKGETAQKCTAFTQEKGFSFPCLFDKDGTGARFFSARTTNTYIIDAKGVLRYSGPLEQGGKAYAREALAAVLAGKEVAESKVKDTAD